MFRWWTRRISLLHQTIESFWQFPKWKGISFSWMMLMKLKRWRHLISLRFRQRRRSFYAKSGRSKFCWRPRRAFRIVAKFLILVIKSGHLLDLGRIYFTKTPEQNFSNKNKRARSTTNKSWLHRILPKKRALQRLTWWKNK